MVSASRHYEIKIKRTRFLCSIGSLSTISSTEYYKYIESVKNWQQEDIVIKEIQDGLSNKNYLVINKKNDNKVLLKLLGVLVLISACFGAGMYASSKNEVIKELSKKEVVYIGKIIVLNTSEQRFSVIVSSYDYSTIS